MTSTQMGLSKALLSSSSSSSVNKCILLIYFPSCLLKSGSPSYLSQIPGYSISSHILLVTITDEALEYSVSSNPSPLPVLFSRHAAISLITYLTLLSSLPPDKPEIYLPFQITLKHTYLQKLSILPRDLTSLFYAYVGFSTSAITCHCVKVPKMLAE